MGLDHRLRRVRDQIAGHEGIFHAGVSHGDTIADSDRRDNDREAARFCYAELDGLCDLVKVHMARNDLIPGADNRNERLIHFLLCHAERIPERAVRSLLETLFNSVTSHNNVLLSDHKPEPSAEATASFLISNTCSAPKDSEHFTLLAAGAALFHPFKDCISHLFRTDELAAVRHDIGCANAVS